LTSSPPGRDLALPSAVQCRIRVLDEDEIREVRVAGRLADAQVPDLLIACSEASGAVRVDLTDLSSADAIATEALSRLRDGGVELLNVPRYLQITLDGLAHKPAKR
jgi:hypothetical protein